jgi:hypothetical protein
MTNLGNVGRRPIAVIGRWLKSYEMLWWDWNTWKRLALLTAMLTLAATPCLLLGWLNEWRAFVGGTAFLAIPQIVAWNLFVGLKTGRMPSAYGRSELRAESPTWFWLTGSLYAALVLLFLWAILGMFFGLPMPGF